VPVDGEAPGTIEEEPPDLMSLVSPFGVVGRVWNVPSPRGLPRLKISATNAGVPDAHRRIGGHSRTGGPSEITTHGLAIDDVAAARVIAVAEAAERYAGVSHGVADGDAAAEWIWSSASEMREPIVDPARLPRCADAEYSHPRCPLVPFDADGLIRWSRGVDLASGDALWVPSAMAIYWLTDRAPTERFWHSISTGYAVHTDPYLALCSAICEVIERDIIEILWAQRLPLPPVADAYVSADCSHVIDWCADHFLETLLFDATSDVGVPTVYCLMRAEHDDVFRANVSCATGVTMTAAADKAVRDAVSRRVSAERDRPVKTDVSTFTSIEDGARYMALPGNASAFDFLVDGYHDRGAVSERAPLPDDPRDRLRHLVETLTSKGMQAIAVDRTTTELAGAGLTAVCAIIPDLQPMALNPLARFRAHPRLYSAPALMGYPACSEKALNPWPQPFA
jgi:ribosomal protein S12 methylthiotransferase accessory factor